MKLVNIGFGSMVSPARVVAIISPDSAPVKRLGQEARERGVLIDASFGRKTQSVLVMDSGHVIWSSLPTQEISARFREGEKDSEEKEEEETP